MVAKQKTTLLALSQAQEFEREFRQFSLNENSGSPPGSLPPPPDPLTDPAPTPDL